eukprot:TRINITY_DN136246_c0_g1_i1.p1 TRINITY_DN136246_c0_g1~~TRINITY_DN136246_c0_g1_i1.p1  ORF type:complete len:159 (-),score=68.20 TRINITY_DN136246_c0_g1_i1:45-521(-)
MPSTNKPLFTKFVEIGRVAFIQYGEHKGQLVTVVDVVDQAKALVEGPKVPRTIVPFRWVSLTSTKIPILRNAKTKTILKAWTDNGVDKKWAESNFGKKLAAQEKRANLTDFDRFKLTVLRAKRNRAVRGELNKLRSAHNKAAKKQEDVIPKSIAVPLK